MSESQGERYSMWGERYHDSILGRDIPDFAVTALLNEHERWRQEREAREHITVNGEPEVTTGRLDKLESWYKGLDDSIKILRQRFESLDDSVCETDDAVAALEKRIGMCSDQQACHFDAAQTETRLDSLQGQLLALERRLDAVPAPAPPETCSATTQYATAQDIAALRNALADGFERIVRQDIERLGVDLREQLTHMHADLGKALAAAHVGGGETLLAVESTVRNGFERVIRMLHDVMARMPGEKKL